MSSTSSTRSATRSNRSSSNPFFTLTEYQVNNGYDSHLCFDVLNNDSEPEIPPALINGIRRTILQYVPVIIFDRDSIEFKENSSMLHNDMLSHRLVNCALNVEVLRNYDLSRLRFVWEASNPDSYMKTYHYGDCKIYNGEEELSEEQVKAIVPFPETIIGKLRRAQSISFQAKVKEVLGADLRKLRGCAESQIVFYSFKRDEEKIKQALKDGDTSLTPGLFGEEQLPRPEDENNFLQSKANKLYLTNKNEFPQVYQFELESNGFYSPEQAFSNGLLLLFDRLNKIKEALETSDTEKAKIVASPNNATQWDLILVGEDDTLGNLLSTYAQLDFSKKTTYGGYYVPHPLDKRVIVRIGLLNEKENTLVGARKYYLQLIDQIKNIINILNENWVKMIKEIEKQK